MPEPCPFCGSTNIQVIEGSTFRWAKASCVDCEASAGEVRIIQAEKLDSAENERLAMEEWNTRAEKDNA